MNQYSMMAPGIKQFSHEALSRSLFVARSPTPGTGLLSTDAATARSATVGLVNIYNACAVDGTQPHYIIPIRLRLRMTAVNTTASNFRLDFYSDVINRFTSGGTNLTPVPVIFSGEADYVAPTTTLLSTQRAAINAGILVLTAESAETLLATRLVSNAIFVAGDIVDLWFGGANGVPLPQNTTNMLSVGDVLPPMWIRPGGNLSIHGYGASQAASPDPEVELTFLFGPGAN